MIPSNPGNLLKFNLHAVFQRHKQAGQDRHPFGLRCPSDTLIPFQLFVSAGAGSVTWKLVNPLDSGDFINMDAADLTVENKSGGGFWVTWYGVGSLTTPVECGYWEVWLIVDGTTYVSEVLHVFDIAEEPLPLWRLRMSHATDKANVLYQNVYQQLFFPKRWAWDRPEVDRDVEITVDGNGNETIRYSRSVARFRLEVSDLPDYTIPFFAKIGDLDDVSFEDTVEGYSVVMSNTTFESRNQGKGLNIGVFTFDAEVESFNGCQENFTLE